MRKELRQAILSIIAERGIKGGITAKELMRELTEKYKFKDLTERELLEELMRLEVSGIIYVSRVRATGKYITLRKELKKEWAS